MKLYVVIVNYRRADLTVETVRSLRSCPECAHGCVVLVDNASGDGSSERFRAECFDCVVLGAGANRGFAGGNNIGIQYALEHGATHVLLLNNDTVVDSAFLGRLLAVMDEHAIVTPRIMYAGAVAPA